MFTKNKAASKSTQPVKVTASNQTFPVPIIAGTTPSSVSTAATISIPSAIPLHKLDAISLNNLAIQSLEDNNLICACEFITVAFRLIQQQYKTQLSSKFYSFQWSKSVSLSTGASDLEDFGHFLFTRGIYLRDLRQEKEIRCTSRTLNTDIEATIIYNAGLIFQLFAIKKRKSSLLVKARHFYQLCQTTLKKANEKGIKSKLCYTLFFHVALLNNLGQLSYELVDYQSSNHYFDQLKKDLKYLIEKSKLCVCPHRKIEYIFDRSDLLGMLSNTVVQVPTTAPTA